MTAPELLRLQERVRVISDVARRFAEATTDYQRLLESVARCLAETLKDACVLFLLDERGEALVPCSLHAVDAAVLEAYRENFASLNLDLKQHTVLKALVSSGKSLLIPKLADQGETSDARRKWEQLIGLHSVIIVPMRVQSRPIGALTLSRYRQDSPPFEQQELELAQNLADHAALAIENARLYQAAEQARSAMVSDQAKRIKAELQLRQAQKMEAVGRLAGGIAHDFNNVLLIILGYSADILSEPNLTGQMREGLEEIQAAADRAAQLTRQLLMFSRQQVLEPQVLDLNQVLLAIERMLGRVLGEHLELVIKPAAGLGKVFADRGNVEQVIMNLAVNARDAMPGGGRLTIETANVVLDDAFVREHLDSKPGEYVLLGVSDTGSGMNQETSARIFEPFFTTKELGKGTGLGLSTVLGIVQQSGGSIYVYSEPGLGTSFKVYLPRAQAEVAAQPAKAAAAVLRGSETVLLVEDEPSVRDVARRILERFGYAVVTASTAAEALTRAEAHAGAIQLLLTDVVMPGENGVKLAEQLVQRLPGLKVLFMSGYTDGSIGSQGLQDGVVAFLQKPFSAEALGRKVRAVLDGQES